MAEDISIDPNDYIIVERSDEALLTFREPTEQSLAQLAPLLSMLPILPVAPSPSGQHRKDNAYSEGELSSIIDSLLDVLRRDYSENLNEWKGNFEYNVYRSNHWPGSIEVLTRLYSLEKPGSVFYGRMLRRISLDRYLMWVDD